MKKDFDDLLLELGVEELPAGYIRPAVEELKHKLLKRLDESKISYGKSYSAATPNILVCFIKDVSLRQKIEAQKIYGPSKDAAFDAKGQPTIKAIGFAKSQGLRLEELTLEKNQRGEYLVAEKKTAPKDIEVILKQTFPDIIKNIRFPKTMKWDTSGLRFARPLKSALILFGEQQIKVSIGAIKHKKVKNISASQYLKQIQKNTLIDPDARKEKIKGLIIDISKDFKLKPSINEELLEEVTFMVTRPEVFIGEFDKKYLTLPEDVLKASMSKYQRLFPLLDKEALTNKFVAVINGDKKALKAIKKIYERILEARLKDSLFFLTEDTKKAFSENAGQLKDLIFNKDLGNMFEKIERLKKISHYISEKLNIESSLKIDLERTAELCKCDLVTHMVGEFPRLQGVMGCEYALRNGEKKSVAIAIREHYLPQGSDDPLPQSTIGAILAISDRLDNIVGLLGLGVDIKSSFDPFGIRRNTQGMIQIINNTAMRLNIKELIELSSELYGGKLKLSTDGLTTKIITYIKERIDFLSGNLKPVELKKAVLSVECFDIVNIFKRIKSLFSIQNEAYFLEAAKVVERTSNIIKGAKGVKIPQVNASLLKEGLEQKLWDTYINNKDSIEALIDKEDYKEATRKYGEAFYKILHEFFDKVLVNVEDSAIRLNRLAIMKAINKLYIDRIADLSLLPQIVVK